MGMKKQYLGILGLAAIISEQNSYPITTNPESEQDKRRRQYQQELEDEYLQNEYLLIQKKESKLSASQRKKIVIMYEKRFGNSNTQTYGNK